MSGPVRHLQIAADLVLYVSDRGFVVVAEAVEAEASVCFSPDKIDEVIAGLRAIKDSAIARQAMTDAMDDAQYQAHLKGGQA